MPGDTDTIASMAGAIAGARYGLVALSQIRSAENQTAKNKQRSIELNYWEIKQHLYSPVLQGTVVIKGRQQRELALRLLRYIKSEQFKPLLISHGYSVE